MDKKFLSIAINLAKKNLGKTAPNPSVGCVIVKDGKIISSGATQINGRPHAESVAIAKIKDKSQIAGSTLYVSLEPCCHTGQTPPCTESIIQAKISRVVIASKDPDLRVAGQGIKTLQNSGIQTDLIEIDEAYEINRGYFKAKTTSLPFTTLKMATSLDGKIATKNYQSKWITNKNSRKFGHILRSLNDGILVGANTLKKDNPSLDCRISGLEDFSPKRFVISSKLDFDESFNIFQSANKIPTFIITSQDKESHDLSKFTNLGVSIIFCKTNNEEICLDSALKEIHKTGVNSLLIEGGQNLATKMLKNNLIDEINWIQSDKIIGNDGICAIGDLDFDNIEDVLQNFHLKSTANSKSKNENSDLIKIYKKD